MKIILVGGTGTIGSSILKELSSRHEVVIAGRKEADLVFDMTSEKSIHQMYEKAGEFHAVVVAAGSVHFGDFSDMTVEKYQIGINSKLMGQVNLVLIGHHFIQEGGSFTLTSGILNRDPIRAGSSASMVNGAIEGFSISAAIELTRGIRINVVSPTILRESLDIYGPYFRGFNPVPAQKVALAYCKSVEGLQTGQIYRVE